MIIIGEKINGSIPVVAEAIANRDAEFIKNRAIMQAEANASFIDCCASVPEEQEGWYFPVSLNEPGAATMTFFVNGKETKKDIAYDPQVLFRVPDNEASFRIVTNTGKWIEFDFDGLMLEEKA